MSWFITHKPSYERVLDLAEQRGYIVYWGKVGFSVRMQVPTTGKLASFVYVTQPKTARTFNSPS